jgi:Mg-chelatase subunit ChlD
MAMKQIYTLLFFLLSCLAFSEGMHVTGLVKDMDTDLPLQGAFVRVTFYDGYAFTDVTDSAGRYDITTTALLPDGDYDIEIKCKNYYSLYGFIHVKKTCFNEHRLKREKQDTTAVAQKALDGFATNNLVFLVDISSSMNAPEKMPMLKQSLKYLVDALRPADRIAILTFSSAVKEVLPSTPASDKEAIYKTIDALSFGSTSQGGAALDVAYKTVLKDFIDKGNNRVILASDGLFTSGEKDYKKMEQVIESGLDKNIALSVFCFGKNTDYVIARLKKLTQAGKGNFAQITSLEDGKMHMMEEARAVKSR